LSKVLFSGVEIPSNRTLLERAGVDNVMLNFWGLRKRGMPKNKQYYIAEYFQPNMKVWVDSGAIQADKANLSKQELETYAADYQDFIAMNYDRIEGWVEFDSKTMGIAWVMQQRAAFERDPKLIVVWHDSYNQRALREWAAQGYQIAIPGDVIESVPTLAAITRDCTRLYGTKFHALATAKPDNLRQIAFETASTLSWLSPMRRGETIIWDGAKLVRYPKSMKDQARLRYKNIVEKAGLDYKKFVSDDTLEATKVAVWSYLQLESKMDKKDKPDLKVIKGDLPSIADMLSDNSDDTLYTGLMDFDPNGSNNSGSEMRKVERTEVVQRDPSELTSMPVFGYQMKTVVENEDGRDVLKDVPIVQNQYASLRQCNTCFVAANCPAFKEDNTCAFNLPIEVKTPEQLKAMNTALLEMQAQRVAFMRFAEEMNGGYADPNVSQEMDRYFRMLEKLKALDETKEFIQITAQKNASQGVLSAIFGDRVQAMKDAPPPISEEKTTLIIRDTIEK
jgi:hypothetical protein